MRWNLWRNKHATIPSLEGLDLREIDLDGADFSDVNLAKANLVGAHLANVNFEGANLASADLSSTNLTDANLTNANLAGASLDGAKIGGAMFTNAIVTPETLGMRGLTEDQQREVHFVLDVNEANDSLEGSDAQETRYAGKVTVDRASSIVAPASLILEGLDIPNEPDFKEEDRDLIRELQRAVKELKEKLEEVEDENRRLSEVPIVLDAIEAALPHWRQAWLTFVGSAGGALAGSITSHTAAYTAGFIAGVLHDTFSPAETCLL